MILSAKSRSRMASNEGIDISISTHSVRSAGFTSEIPVLGCSDCFAKQTLQSTGFVPLGLNGTVVAMPHPEQVTRTSILWCPSALTLQGLQRFGSFANPFSWKNCCSAAEKTNVEPHWKHVNSRSTKSKDCPIVGGGPIAKIVNSLGSIGQIVGAFLFTGARQSCRLLRN